MAAEEARGFAGVVVVAHGDQVLFSGAYGPASRRWLDLDASIHDYLELAGTPIPEQVTLRHLLTHTSGRGSS